MAKGDPGDMQSRLRRALPIRWFSDESPVLDVVLGGFGALWSAAYERIAELRLNIRLATATGDTLDLMAIDFFGLRISRRNGEQDPAFRARIRRELFRPKATRAALVSTVEELVGVGNVTVIEYANVSDTGAWDDPSLAYDEAGALGDYNLPYQCQLTVVRPPTGGIPDVGSWDDASASWDGPDWTYTEDRDFVGFISDQEIRDAALSVIPLATVVWLAITNQPPNADTLDDNFILDESEMV